MNIIQRLFFKLQLFFLLIGSILSLSTSAIAAENVITLDEATALALKANPEIAVVLRAREAESGFKLQAAARPNPTLSTLVEDLRSQYRNSTILISQQLETAGKRDRRMVAADSNIALADADILITQAEISAKVYAAYYQLLAAQQAQALAIELLQISTQSRETTAKRVLAGKVSPVEETKAKVVEAGLKIELAAANQELAFARKRLASLWLYEPIDNIAVDSPGSATFFAAGELDNINEIPTLSELITQLQNSPRLQKATLAITQKQALRDIEKAKQTPDVTVSLGAKRNEELGGITQAVIGLSIPIPVFDRNQGNLQGAQARQLQAESEKIALQNQLTIDLTDAYGRRQLQIEAAKTYVSDILPGAQSAYEAARKGFDFGKFSFLEVLDAQRTLFQAKTQFLQTLALARQAQADIQNILGLTNGYEDAIKNEMHEKEVP
ncbi:MAG TPA: TolC family protein [Methylotenera sp.]|nr:TolC family protein [Methylotenera sp.]